VYDASGERRGAAAAIWAEHEAGDEIDTVAGDIVNLSLGAIVGAVRLPNQSDECHCRVHSKAERASLSSCRRPATGR
jgi:hypothetical protein